MSLNYRKVSVKIKDQETLYEYQENRVWYLIEGVYLHTFTDDRTALDIMNRYPDPEQLKGSATVELRRSEGIHLIDNTLARKYYGC